ncbi:MAG: hypothetical protein NW201_01300 [Gemmatimonadales bacterium]|nr:hypothetical protein [Gemmatimonadales bacterium]
MNDVAVSLDAVLPPVAYADWSRPLDLAVPAGGLGLVEATAQRAADIVRLVAGVHAPRAGVVRVLGEVPPVGDRRGVQAFRRRLGVALLPGGLTSNLSLRMNVIVPLVYGGLADAGEAARRADAALAACEVAHVGALRPADVSLDLRQRAALARAVAREPELLLLEEPFGSIDQDDVPALLETCRRAAGTVLVVTHTEDHVLRRHAGWHVEWENEQVQEFTGAFRVR